MSRAANQKVARLAAIVASRNLWLALDLSIAGYFLAYASVETIFNGFESVFYPIDVKGVLVEQATPGSLFVFGGFLLLFMLKQSPLRAPFAALFAVGTFDSIASLTSAVWGAPAYLVGFQGTQIVTWLSFIMWPWLLMYLTRDGISIRNRRAWGMLLFVTAVVMAWQLSMAYLPWPPIWFQRLEENLIEAFYCFSAYQFFAIRPRA